MHQQRKCHILWWTSNWCKVGLFHLGVDILLRCHVGCWNKKLSQQVRLHSTLPCQDCPQSNDEGVWQQGIILGAPWKTWSTYIVQEKSFWRKTRSDAMRCQCAAWWKRHSWRLKRQKRAQWLCLNEDGPKWRDCTEQASCCQMRRRLLCQKPKLQSEVSFLARACAGELQWWKSLESQPCRNLLQQEKILDFLQWTALGSFWLRQVFLEPGVFHFHW